MDWTILVIGFLLVWTGANFFGYPIGKKVGRRQERRLREAQEMFFGEPTVVALARQRSADSDILSAEILEEVGNGLSKRND